MRDRCELAQRKICDFDNVIAGDENIVRLQIPMKDSSMMEIRNALQNLKSEFFNRRQ